MVLIVKKWGSDTTLTVPPPEVATGSDAPFAGKTVFLLLLSKNKGKSLNMKAKERKKGNKKGYKVLNIIISKKA